MCPAGVRPRQQIYQICTRLEAAGHIWRESLEKSGKRKKIHNFPVEAKAGIEAAMAAQGDSHEIG